MCLAVLELMFSTPFPKARPSWLKHSIESNRHWLELDGYSCVMRAGFEYQGYQHFEALPNGYRASNDDVLAIRSRDAQKRRMCWDNNVSLIVVPEVSDLSDINRFINQVELAVLGTGLKIPRRWGKVRPTLLSEMGVFAGVAVFDDINKLASERGGVCLSTTYISVKTKMVWRCARGHVWMANWNSIQNGTWCPTCPKEDVQARVNSWVELIIGDWNNPAFSTETLLKRANISYEVVREKLGGRFRRNKPKVTKNPTED